MKHLVFVITFVFFSCISLFAQKGYNVYVENDSVPRFNNRIGFQASSFTGFGLYYQRHLDNEFAIKINFLGFGSINDNSSSSQDLYTTVGLDFQYNFFSTRLGRFYGFLGMSHWFNQTSNRIIEGNVVVRKEYDITRQFVIGPGVGFEVSSGRFSLFGEVGYQFRASDKSGPNYDNPQYSIYHNKNPKYFGIGAGCGVAIMF